MTSISFLMYIAQQHTQLPYPSSAHSVLPTSARVFCWQCVAIYITSLSHSKQFQTTIPHYDIIHIYTHNNSELFLSTGWQWCNVNHLLSIDDTGNSSKLLMDFITIRITCVSHTQSLHKHKYYYYNLQNFVIVPCPVWHT